MVNSKHPKKSVDRALAALNLKYEASFIGTLPKYFRQQGRMLIVLSILSW
ncbi:MAG: hypothetical protein ACOYU2_06310 [Nitrospirota bacterium]